DAGIKVLIGSELTLGEGTRLLLLVQDLRGYESLCELITAARRAAPKGEYKLRREDFPAGTEGLLCLWLDAHAIGDGDWIAATFPGRAYIAVELHRGDDDEARIAELEALGRELGLPCVAAGDAHMHERERKRLQDVMSAIRLQCTCVTSWTRCPTSRSASRCTTSCASRAARGSSARVAAPTPIRRCATASASPRSIRGACRCCSSASSRRSETSRRTSTSISS